MLPEAILFDLDDTILSDDAVSEQAWKKTCEACVHKLKPISGDELFSQINNERISFWSDPANAGEGTKNLFRARLIIVESAIREFGIKDVKIAIEIVNTYNTLKAELVKLFPYAEQTLIELKSCGIKMALITNGEAEMQRAKVEKTGLEKYFPVCLIEGELGYGKPDPRIFQLALDSLQVSSTSTWMVGDRLEFDILGAQKMGIFSIWNDYAKKGLPKGSKIVPDRIINNITELLKI
jgi:putative hydrolase of the HAD superfamily